MVLEVTFTGFDSALSSDHIQVLMVLYELWESKALHPFSLKQNVGNRTSFYKSNTYSKMYLYVNGCNNSRHVFQHCLCVRIVIPFSFGNCIKHLSRKKSFLLKKFNLEVHCKMQQQKIIFNNILVQLKHKIYQSAPEHFQDTTIVAFNPSICQDALLYLIF